MAVAKRDSVCDEIVQWSGYPLEKGTRQYLVLDSKPSSQAKTTGKGNEKDFSGHLRTIQFSLLALCLGLVVVVLSLRFAKMTGDFKINELLDRAVSIVTQVKFQRP